MRSNRHRGFGADQEWATLQQKRGSCDYGGEIPRELVAALEKARQRGLRIRIRYPWHQEPLGPGTRYPRVRTHEWGTEGYVGCTQGWGPHPVRAVMLIANRRAMGGHPLITRDVVEVRCANKRECGILYERAGWQQAWEADSRRKVR